MHTHVHIHTIHMHICTYGNTDCTNNWTAFFWEYNQINQSTTDLLGKKRKHIRYMYLQLVHDIHYIKVCKTIICTVPPSICLIHL